MPAMLQNPRSGNRLSNHKYPASAPCTHQSSPDLSPARAPVSRPVKSTMDYTRRALGALGLARDPAAAPTNNTPPGSSQDQVGPDGRRRCRFFDEERNERHPECCKCSHILKKPPPCMCDICHALNFPVPSRPVSPKQGARSSAQAAAAAAKAPQTGRDAMATASVVRHQTGDDGRQTRQQQQQQSSSGTEDWVRVESPAWDVIPVPDQVGADDGSQKKHHDKQKRRGGRR
ncbi:hypothetical protein RB595_005085 [Gaeumannomyces hyphopodioides]